MNRNALITPVRQDERAALGDFVFAHNRLPDGTPRCLHSDQGATAEDHRRELLALAAAESCFVVARRGDRWTGVAGAEFDSALGRAWMRAPLVAAAEADGDAAALRRALLTAVVAALPSAATRLDAFVNPDDLNAHAPFEAAGWTSVSVHHVLRATADTVAAAARATAAGHDARVRSVGAHDPAATAAMPLHESLFPTSYLPPPALLASLDETHRLFIALDGGAVAGYLYAQHRVEDDDGYVDYLGVEPAARGRGLGRALLRAALDWLIVERGAPWVDLTVRTDRAEALALYAGCGFARLYSGVQWRLERATAAA
jgi:ribosomal protein S18 acetylase RimI-like enzyme